MSLAITAHLRVLPIIIITSFISPTIHLTILALSLLPTRQTREKRLPRSLFFIVTIILFQLAKLALVISTVMYAPRRARINRHIAAKARPRRVDNDLHPALRYRTGNARSRLSRGFRVTGLSSATDFTAADTDLAADGGHCCGGCCDSV